MSLLVREKDFEEFERLEFTCSAEIPIEEPEKMKQEDVITDEGTQLRAFDVTVHATKKIANSCTCEKEGDVLHGSWLEALAACRVQ